MNRRTIFIFITVVIAACVAAVLSACNFLGNSGCGNNHEYGEVVVVTAPTCIEDGTGKRVCAVCGNEKSGFVLKSKGHDFGKKVVEKEATCDEQGKESKTCSVCEYKEEFVISRRPHELGEWEIKLAPTCTAFGERVKKCKFCDYKITETLALYAHNYEEEERKKSTCEEPGYVKYVCSECGETKTDVTEKMNHSFPAGTEIKYDYMDNSNENYCYNAYRECDRCHKDVFYKTKSHSMDKDVENHVEATCATTGVNAKKCRYCSRKTTEITPVNPLKHERGSVVYGERNAENCTIGATVSCTLCGKEVDGWNEPRHDYEEETFVCTGKGCNSVKEIPSSYFTYSLSNRGGWAIKGINRKKTEEFKKYIDDNDGRMRLPSQGRSASSEFAVESVLGKVFDALGEEYTSKIKYIYVPLGYTYIFSYAFADLSDLNKITFPKTVTGIENHALAGCKNLTELTLPYDSYADIIGIFGAKKDTLTGYKLTTLNVHRPNGKSTVEFLSGNCVLFENLTTVNIHTEFIGGITYMVDGRKINDSKTVFKNGVDETSGTITYYLK